MRVVATAGHVDHGKSSLVLALTGTDPDRFSEEKERGLTIDLGFAFTALPSGETLAFVDVPGHVRFLKNMLAGVGAVEAAVLVVAANEGWMPQSEEHLHILELLGVKHAIAVLTKAALVDDEMLELARLELDDRLASSALAGIPIVACDSKTGAGLHDVRGALDALVSIAPMATDHGRPRLWVDRVFAARGAGTVITGTLAGGALNVDDEMQLLPGRRKVRIRALESHHDRLATAAAGSRVAVNLVGVEHSEVKRGDVLVRAGQWIETRTVDVALALLPGVEIPRRAAYKAYIGSGEHDVHVRVIDGDARWARAHLARPLPLAPGDRFVLRESGRQRTVGGAEVLDVAPTGRVASAADRLPHRLPRRILAGRPWLKPIELIALAGVDSTGADALAGELVASGDAVRVGDWIAEPGAVAALRHHAADEIAAHHRRAPLEPGIDVGALASALRVEPSQLRAAIEGFDGVVVEQGRARLPGHAPAVTETPEAKALLTALRAAPFAPPNPSDLGAPPALVRALVRTGAVVDLDGVIFAADALEVARTTIVNHIARQGTVTVGDARDLLGSSRRYVLAILSRLDTDGVTRRRGDDRILGPRAGDVAGSS